MVLGRLQLIPMCIALVACLAIATQKGPQAAEKVRKPVVMKHLKYDPSLPQMGLFDAMDEEKVSVRLVAKNEFEGHLLVENKTDAPLTIELPEAFVGVQVNAQFGGGGMGGGGMGGGGMGGGGMGGMGGGQAMGGGGMGGGGMGGGGMGGGGMGGGGGGFFSIPVATVAKVPVNAVCLEHGKKNPTQRLHYTIIRPEEFSSDPRVHEICKMVATGRLDRASAQAAAWHVSNNMSWEELANKTIPHLGGQRPSPYFTHNQLATAQAIVSGADQRVAVLKERGELKGTASAPKASSASTASQK